MLSDLKVVAGFEKGVVEDEVELRKTLGYRWQYTSLPETYAELTVIAVVTFESRVRTLLRLIETKQIPRVFLLDKQVSRFPPFTIISARRVPKAILKLQQPHCGVGCPSGKTPEKLVRAYLTINRGQGAPAKWVLHVMANGLESREDSCPKSSA